MRTRVVIELNKEGYLLYSETFKGAYARGTTLEECMSKLPYEINRTLNNVVSFFITCLNCKHEIVFILNLQFVLNMLVYE